MTLFLFPRAKKSMLYLILDLGVAVSLRNTNTACVQQGADAMEYMRTPHGCCYRIFPVRSFPPDPSLSLRERPRKAIRMLLLI